MPLTRGFVRSAVVTVAVWFVTSTAASAGFIFTAQERYVTGEVGGALGHAGPQTFTATDFGLFDAATSLTVPTYGGSANQRQRSQLLSDVITVSGGAGVYRPGMVGTGWANARSYTSVRFDIDEPTEVTLTASGSDFVGGIPIHEIRLLRTAPTMAYVSYWDALGDADGLFAAANGGSRAGSFTLIPGSYQFVVDMQSYDTAIAGQSHGVPNFNVSLAIPEPGGALVGAGVFALAARPTRRRSMRDR
jgi:hypothetical protein